MIRGRRLTYKESMRMLIQEIDRALTLPDNINEILAPFIIDESVSTNLNRSRIGDRYLSEAEGYRKIDDIVSTDGDIR